MFCVIYKFQVQKALEEQFKQGWTKMTKLLRDENGSLGSRLHKTIEELPSDTSVTYIAYAQWPSEEAWLNNTNTTPAGQEARKQMRESLIDGQNASEVVFKLDVVKDLLVRDKLQ